jgi:hypothetical protein
MWNHDDRYKLIRWNYPALYLKWSFTSIDQGIADVLLA